MTGINLENGIYTINYIIYMDHAITKKDMTMLKKK